MGLAAISRKPVRTTAAQRWMLALASLASFIVILDMLVVATVLTAGRNPQRPAPASGGRTL